MQFSMAPVIGGSHTKKTIVERCFAWTASTSSRSVAQLLIRCYSSVADEWRLACWRAIYRPPTKPTSSLFLVCRRRQNSRQRRHVDLVGKMFYMCMLWGWSEKVMDWLPMTAVEQEEDKSACKMRWMWTSLIRMKLAKCMRRSCDSDE